MTKRSSLEDLLLDQLSKDEFWPAYLRDNIFTAQPNFSLHLAVFSEPFLEWVLIGKKTVESRFSKNEIIPFQSIDAGDVILLKEVGGPITGICLTDAAWSYRLDPKTLSHIKLNFSDYIGEIDDGFWAAREDSRFATLMSISHVRRLSSIPFAKSDRRGWIIHKRKYSQMSLNI